MTAEPNSFPVTRSGERVSARVARLPAGSTAFNVVTGIRTAIQRGDLRAGDQLADEDGLSVAFGISRRLVHRGLLLMAETGQASRDGATGWRLAPWAGHSL